MEVTHIRGDKLKGRLNSFPALIPGLAPDDKIRFRLDDIADIVFEDDGDRVGAVEIDAGQLQRAVSPRNDPT